MWIKIFLLHKKNFILQIYFKMLLLLLLLLLLGNIFLKKKNFPSSSVTQNKASQWLYYCLSFSSLSSFFFPVTQLYNHRFFLAFISSSYSLSQHPILSIHCLKWLTVVHCYFSSWLAIIDALLSCLSLTSSVVALMVVCNHCTTKHWPNFKWIVGKGWTKQNLAILFRCCMSNGSNYNWASFNSI